MENVRSLFSSREGRLIDVFFSVLRFLLKLSVWAAQQLLFFHVDSVGVLNSCGREDTSAVELEAILVTVKPRKSIKPYLV